MIAVSSLRIFASETVLNPEACVTADKPTGCRREEYKTDGKMDNFRVEEMFRRILERLDSIDDKMVVKKQRVHPLDGDALLDNQDMCQLLGVTKRTLARYRQKKLVSYYMIDGRTYYKASEVQTFLKKKGRDMPPEEKPNLK